MLTISSCNLQTKELKIMMTYEKMQIDTTFDNYSIKFRLITCNTFYVATLLSNSPGVLDLKLDNITVARIIYSLSPKNYKVDTFILLTDFVSKNLDCDRLDVFFMLLLMQYAQPTGIIHFDSFNPLVFATKI